MARNLRAAVLNLHRRTPLRVRLVAILLVLVIAALAGSGIASAAIMRSYLVGRVDSQLKAVSNQPVDGLMARGSTLPSPDQGHGHDGDRGQLPSAFVLEITDSKGKVVLGPTSQLINPGQPLPQFPAVTGSTATDTRLVTVGAVRGDDQWRVLAKPVTLTDGSPGVLLVAQSLQDVQRTATRLLLLFAVVGAAAVVVLAGVGYVVVRLSLRPLNEVERTAAAIAAGDLTQRVPELDPRTEVGQLSSALNTMLTEIESAFAERAASEAAARTSEDAARRSEEVARRSEDRMRRFVADASHELRTPLTTIRGFAELYRQGAATDADAMPRLIRRIEDEAARMGLLVDDLLLLARMDQQRPLQQTPVDLLAIATEAAQDARVLDPQRQVRLQIGATDPPPIVLGDDARLRQVVANLTANAIKHTPPGTPVTIAVRVEAPDDPVAHLPVAVLEVADEGPGMTRGEAERVFERFYRADPARNSEGGTGLGLAIVSAIVAGHGGNVSVDTAPGAGARFRIELPLAPAASGQPR